MLIFNIIYLKVQPKKDRSDTMEALLEQVASVLSFNFYFNVLCVFLETVNPLTALVVTITFGINQYLNDLFSR